ncbi:hypothetical protein P153DRAFT_387519 [Dothidotthia symphoricarpi CBS 119687]|uniref:EthD domain-containing protein n=1 Tax=Dothidotthia symphoricarpi CBS 119687 TaxID=1392245 RepID=A0A6A6A9C9_9PLEO|nr:uncharacterized protein P153DRAFT_387519 [Dothidotthia symphoricarpi CBS 119687]KAF2127785.1 hypothetical protein P153DRAFT_387519 [Dothidotthia symphoricarpi CBS 119687]
MTISLKCFYTRLPTFSPAEFKDYMETVHVGIWKEVMGPHYPETWILRYVERAESGIGDRLGISIGSEKNDPTAPVLIIGTPSELEWDVVGEMVFKDMLHLQQALAVINTPEGQKIKDDEERFTDAGKFQVVVMGATTVLT